MSVATERERMTWDDLGTGARELAAQVVADGYEPDLILGIARGASSPPERCRSTSRDQRVLIADDVADTGQTLALVKAFIAGKVREARVAVLYEKPRSIVSCEYVWRRTDRWIDFPWSAPTLP